MLAERRKRDLLGERDTVAGTARILNRDLVSRPAGDAIADPYHAA
jgi:hypothetical protein